MYEVCIMIEYKEKKKKKKEEYIRQIRQIRQKQYAITKSQTVVFEEIISPERPDSRKG